MAPHSQIHKEIANALQDDVSVSCNDGLTHVLYCSGHQ